MAATSLLAAGTTGGKWVGKSPATSEPTARMEPTGGNDRLSERDFDGGWVEPLTVAGIAEGGNVDTGEVDALRRQIGADGLGAAEGKVVAVAVVGTGHVDRYFDRTRGMLPHEVDQAVQLNVRRGEHTCGAGQELHQGEGQRGFEKAQLVKGVGTELDGQLGGRNERDGGHIKPVGCKECHIGLAAVETEGEEGVEVDALAVMDGAAAFGIDYVQPARHGRGGGQTEGDCRAGGGGIVDGGSPASGIGAAVRGAGGDKQTLLRIGKGDKGLVETAVEVAPQVDRLGPVGPVADM